MVGDEVCITGYIMDNFCIFDNGGVLLDNRTVTTLKNPEQHSYHCLLDVPLCYNSGFQVLGEKDPTTKLHCLGFRLDDTETVLAAGRGKGKMGYCTSCGGGMDTDPEYGYRATVKGTVKELGDGTTGLVTSTPMLTNIEVLDDTVECGDDATIPPLCVRSMDVTASSEPSSSVAAFPTSGPTPAPTEMDEFQLSSDLLLRYKVNVPPSTSMDICDGCTVSMEVIYDGEAWLGIGFSEDGQMIGGEAVVGTPEDGNVQKWQLVSKGATALKLMPESQQTLSNTKIEVVNGQTIMKFTKIMREPGEIEISTGDNTFLWAHGSSNTIGYHAKRDSFELNLEVPTTTILPTPGLTTSPTVLPTNQPTAAPTAGGSGGITETMVCPVELATSTRLPQGDIIFSYSVIDDILCGRLESSEESWIGFGISPTGMMAGGDGIIGLPDGNGGGTVSKWKLSDEDGARIQPVPEEKQTLLQSSLVQAGDGNTVMTFAKYLKEDGEHEILVNGENTFLYALGSTNDIGYHVTRGMFRMSISTPPPTSAPTSVLATPTASPVVPAEEDVFYENQLSSDLLLRYKVNVPPSTTMDVCDGCTVSIEVIYDGEAWLGIGFSTDGKMVGSEAVM